MQEIPICQNSVDVAKRRTPLDYCEGEAAPLVQKVDDAQLVGAILSDGVCSLMGIDCQKIMGELQELQSTTCWRQIIANGGLCDVREFDLAAGRVHITTERDEDLERVTIDSPTCRAKIALRDRSHDATPDATPPDYLGLSGSPVTTESLRHGAVDWNYSSAEDEVPPGRMSVEISVGVADKTAMLRDDPRYAVIAGFVENPFSAMGDTVPEVWWNNWAHMMGSALEGEAIPFPGQASARSVPGYFSCALAASDEMLKSAGYSHLSAIPTWQHVLEKFGQRGFEVDDSTKHQEYGEFVSAINEAPLRIGDVTTTLSENAENPQAVALRSWASVAPFALMQWGPEAAGMHYELAKGLDGALRVGDDKYLHYPLEPGHNLWMSRQVV